jgi:Putative beta-barrel porin-2, OmpL-like. bbp2
MMRRKGIAALAACAALTSAAAVVAAAEPIGGSDASQLSLERPMYAADAAPRRPLMNMLDKAGVAKGLDDLGINIYGWVEMSWTHNFEDPIGGVNVGRFFDFENDDHTLNQIDITIERAVAVSGDKFDWGGKMEWIWGGDARFIHANGVFDHYGFPLFPGSPGTGDGPDEQFDPVQFYLQFNVPVGNGIIATGGKFVTLLGYETINPTTSPLYSHSFLFNFAIPFTHTGGMARYALDQNWAFTGAIVRGWDQSFEDNNACALSYMGQIAYTTEHLDIIVTGITGPEQFDSDSDYRSVVDLIVIYRENNWQFVLNADYGYESSAALDGADAQWWGAAGYAIWKINDMFTGVGRLEFFSDADGGRGVNTQLTEVTLGLNIRP